MPPSLLILTRALEIGGAERQIVNLAAGLTRRNWRVAIAVFYGGGSLETEARAAGVEIIDLGKTGRWDVLGFLIRLVREVRLWRPDVLYSFLAGANVLSALLQPLMKVRHLVWGLRASNMDHSQYDRTTRLFHAVEARLSGRPDLIVANSRAGMMHAVTAGFPHSNLRHIPNGIAIEQFAPDASAGRDQRRRWGISDQDFLVGVVARLDPMKGHSTFLEAADLLRERYPAMHFACIGDGRRDFAESLRAKASALGLDDTLTWVGTSKEPVAAFNALDLLCSPSIFGEGFSNAISEAMACGVPCVVTDVGDSALIVGQLGIVVEPGRPDMLADAIGTLHERNESGRSLAARKRIVAEFSTDTMVDRTAKLLTSLLPDHEEMGRTAENTCDFPARRAPEKRP